jgi:hypothetical protein
MATSKNQRSGPKLKPRAFKCEAGHEKLNVKYVPAAGRAFMKLMCVCDGYVPIDTTKPYKPNPIKLKAAGGKSRVWYESSV